MAVRVDLPDFPSPGQAKRELTRRRIAQHHARLHLRFVAGIAPQTAIYLACRKWLRETVVRGDDRHARRLTLAERLGFTLMRRVRGGVTP